MTDGHNDQDGLSAIDPYALDGPTEMPFTAEESPVEAAGEAQDPVPAPADAPSFEVGPSPAASPTPAPAASPAPASPTPPAPTQLGPAPVVGYDQPGPSGYASPTAYSGQGQSYGQVQPYGQAQPYGQQPQPAPYGTPQGYGAVPYQVPYGQVLPPEHPQSTTILVLGALSLVVGLTAPFAWYMGSKAKREIARGAPYRFAGTAMVGYVMGIVMTVLIGLYVGFVLLMVFMALWIGL